jgi:hypothetical protein
MGNTSKKEDLSVRSKRGCKGSIKKHNTKRIKGR